MKYDVVIVGGGTAGCAAAYQLGKAGKKVLIVEKNIHLGGSMTSALVTPMMKTSDNSINNEFLEAFTEKMQKYNASITYCDGNSGWFNPEIAKIVFDELMDECNVDTMFSSQIKALDISNRHINSIEIECNLLSVHIEPTYLIDTTGNCEVCQHANCEFLENNSQYQPTNLRFIMSNIDLEKFSKWILEYDNNREVTTSCIINGEIHLSTAYTWDSNINWALKPLFDDAVAKKILKNEDRNYFQIFTIPGMPSSVALNCPRILSEANRNPLEPTEYAKALQSGRSSILRIANFLKIYFKGFEKSYISNIADMLGVRESKRIRGKYVYTVEDLKSGKKFDNPVLISNYPIDVHSTEKDNSVLEKVNIEYQLPIEALITKDIDNLFVAGRCLSADFYAQAALRIIPSCFSMGVGLAKYLLKTL
ncbi:MAG: FAD-dependent oxidoreductase [Candidatus Gastranaerophilaceae bacterium]